MKQQSTIAAIATPPGDGGIAIVRVSGPRALSLLERVFTPTRPQRRGLRSHRIVLGTLRDADGMPIDEVLAVWMRGPHSYTGEDAAEIHCHGGHVVTQPS